MEHSILHGLQVCGLIVALGGVLFRLLVLNRISRHEFEGEMGAEVSRWIMRAALAAAAGSFVDLFIRTAELEGKTLYAGVNWHNLTVFLSQTQVGRIALLKTILLTFAGFLAWSKPRHQFALLFLLTSALIASTLVSHSAALPTGRVGAVASQIVHIGFAALWLGMLFFVYLTTQTSGAGPDRLPAVVHRFSRWALASVAAIVISGLASALRFVVSPSALFTSAYGLTLSLKLLLLALSAVAGFINWRMFRPQLAPTGGSPTIRTRFARLLELELTAGLMLLLVAGILGAISPPSGPGVSQLTESQMGALLSPRLPPTRLPDPARFVGAAERTTDDLRYAEFTHQWSGVFVAALGLCWLGQALSKKRQNACAYIWPLLLLPFGLFISLVADPEVWILRTYSFREILSNPQVLEHQVGALLVFGLAVLGFRDRKREPLLRPLGKGFPILMIIGSLMLLGHAHSNIGISEELSTLINVQHAIIGSFGLLAGTARWFEIRQLPGAVACRYLWPGALILLGIFMALFYRELTPGPTRIYDPDYSMISRLR